MKALTIHQPFAHLIVTPEGYLPIGAVRKRVENRRWPTHHRGPLLIHAGKSLKWMNGDDWPLMPGRPKLRYSDFPEMSFGAIVGRATLVAMFDIATIRGELPLGHFQWVKNHWHTEGPWCWILQNPIRFDSPIPYRGAQGLFDVPGNILNRQALVG